MTTSQAIEAKNPFDNPGAPKNPEIIDYDKDFVELKCKLFFYYIKYTVFGETIINVLLIILNFRGQT